MFGPFLLFTALFSWLLPNAGPDESSRSVRVSSVDRPMPLKPNRWENGRIKQAKEEISRQDHQTSNAQQDNKKTPAPIFDEPPDGLEIAYASRGEPVVLPPVWQSSHPNRTAITPQIDNEPELIAYTRESSRLEYQPVQRAEIHEPVSSQFDTDAPCGSCGPICGPAFSGGALGGSCFDKCPEGELYAFGEAYGGEGPGGYKQRWAFGTGFIPYLKPGLVAPLVDGVFSMNHGGHEVYSAGFGARYLDPCRCDVLGLNLYYDNQRTGIGALQRIGVGFEYLSRCFDVRVNGYFPIGQNPLKKSSVFECESAMKGFDSELGFGFYLPACLYTYVAAGPYYFTGHHCDSLWGGRARIRVDIREFIYSEVILTHDKTFKSKAQFLVGLNIPLYRFYGGGNTCCSSGCYDCAMGDARSSIPRWSRQRTARTSVLFKQSCCDFDES